MNSKTLKDKLYKLDITSYYKDYSYKKIRKDLLYKAFQFYCDDPLFIDFVSLKTKKGNFHSKIFQKYIEMLQNELPYKIVISRKTIQINNLNDLNFFEGECTFESIPKNGIIRNESNDLFITNSISSVGKPYYFGLITDITIDGKSVIEHMTSYTFNKIYFPIEEKVKVSFLKIKPHHESGVLGHINRIIESLR